jgi:hypothetical protein
MKAIHKWGSIHISQPLSLSINPESKDPNPASLAYVNKSR